MILPRRGALRRAALGALPSLLLLVAAWSAALSALDRYLSVVYRDATLPPGPVTGATVFWLSMSLCHAAVRGGVGTALAAVIPVTVVALGQLNAFQNQISPAWFGGGPPGVLMVNAVAVAVAAYLRGSHATVAASLGVALFDVGSIRLAIRNMTVEGDDIFLDMGIHLLGPGWLLLPALSVLLLVEALQIAAREWRGAKPDES